MSRLVNIPALFCLFIGCFSAFGQVESLGLDVASIGEAFVQQEALGREDNVSRILIGAPVILLDTEADILVGTGEIREAVDVSMDPECDKDGKERPSKRKEKPLVEIRAIGSTGASTDEQILNGGGFETYDIRVLNIPNLVLLYAKFNNIDPKELEEKSPEEVAALIHQDIIKDPSRYLGWDVQFNQESQRWENIALPSQGAINGYLSLEKAMDIADDSSLNKAQKRESIEDLMRSAGKNMSFNEKLALLATVDPEYDQEKASFKKGAREKTYDFVDALAGEKNFTQAGICSDQHFAKAQLMSMMMGDEAKGNVFLYSYSTADQSHMVLGVINPDDPNEVATVNYDTVRTVREGSVNNLSAPSMPDYGTQIRIFTLDGDKWEKPKGSAEIWNSLGAFYNTAMGVEASPINQDKGDGQSLLQATYNISDKRSVSLFRGQTSAGMPVSGVVTVKEKSKSREMGVGTLTTSVHNGTGIGFEERSTIDGENFFVPRFFFNSQKDREFKIPITESSDALIGVRRNISGNIFKVPGAENVNADGSLGLSPRIGITKTLNEGQTRLKAMVETEYVLGLKDGRKITDLSNMHKQLTMVRNYTAATLGVDQKIGDRALASGQLQYLNTQMGSSTTIAGSAQKTFGKATAALNASATLANSNPVFIYSPGWSVGASVETDRFNANMGVDGSSAFGPVFNVGTVIRIGR